MHLDPEQTEESEDRGRQSVLGNREPEGIDRPGFSSFLTSPHLSSLPLRKGRWE